MDERGVEVPPFVAYLAEVRSIGGLSGSPVFVNLAIGRNANGTYDKRGTMPLLGLIRGHFSLPRKPSKHEFTDDELDLKRVNSGISMVTPVSFVADILNSEEFVRERDDVERKVAQDVTGDVAE